MTSIVEIWTLATGTAREVLRTDRLVEAPNWYPGGDALLVNEGGRLYRIPLDAPALHEIPTGAATRCNNDHGISPDGKWIALSSHHEGRGAQIYMVPVEGGAPRRVSPRAPSWWHGWSPDGQWWTYPAVRDDDSRILDIYRLHLATGREERLTRAEGHHDGPDYSADGSLIYYNCDRGGHAQIWVMTAEGHDHSQLFADDHVNWFAHPSPDGQHLIYLAYPPGTEGHPRDLPVSIILCDKTGQDRRRLVSFIGGQGTMNVPNWSPDGSAFAYVRYEPPASP